MTHSDIHPDDPRLTALVLGELDPAEASAVEAAVAASPTLQAAVAGLRETSADLFAALQAEPVPAAAVATAVRPVGSPLNSVSHHRRRSYWLVNAVTLLLFVGVLVALQQSAGTPPLDSLEDHIALVDRVHSRFVDKAEQLPADPTNTAPLSSDLAQQVTLYNDLMQQQRFTEAHVLARQAREANPTSPVTVQMYNQSLHAGRKSNASQFSGGDVNSWHSLHELDWRLSHSLESEAAPSSEVQLSRPLRRENVWPAPVVANGAVHDPQSSAVDAPQPIRAVTIGSSASGLLGGGQPTDGDAPDTRHWSRPYSFGLAQPADTAGNSAVVLPNGTSSLHSHTMRNVTRPQGPDGLNTFDVAPAPEPQPGGTDLYLTPRVQVEAATDLELDDAGVERLYRRSGEAELAERELSLERFGEAGQNAQGAPVQLDALRLRTLNESLAEKAYSFSYFGQPSPDDFIVSGGRSEVRLQQLAELEDLAALRAEAPGAEAYAPLVENDFIVPTGEAALSTFSLDVDTASYSNVRRFLTQQQLPPPDAVRLEELVNYFDYDLPQPQDAEPFSVTLEATSCPWNPLHRLVRIGLQGRELDVSKRPLTRLVFLLDVSGSMSDENKLPLVKQSMQLLVEQLGENDRIAIVTYSDTAQLKLDSTPGTQQETILAAINSLNADGSTNGAGGIQLAYETAAKHFLKDAANRVILCTDGDFNVGVSDDDALVKMIEEKRQSGVFLSIFGYGMGNLKDAKLEGLADKGNGHYGYIDDLEEARKVFLEELTGTLYTIAKDVKLQVEFNPARVGAYRLLGYENRLLAAEDFNNDAVDAGEMGAGHTVTALYEIAPKGDWAAARALKQPAVDELKYQDGTRDEGRGSSETTPAVPPAKQPSPSTLDPRPSTLDELLTIKLRYKQPTGDESVKREFPLPAEPRACSKDLQFAAAVTGFGLLLRNSQYAAGCNWDLVIELAEGAKGDDPTGRRGEFVDLARQARRLWDAAHPSGRSLRLTSTAAEPQRETGPQGLVSKVSDGKFAVLTLGSVDGVQDGQLLDVVGARGAAHDAGTRVLTRLGRIKLIHVENTHSVGEFAPAQAGFSIEVGDFACTLHSEPRP